MLLGFSLAAGLAAGAKPKFNATEVTGRSTGLIVCDLDGDGLQDLILVDQLSLAIFYQVPRLGFTREPQQTCSAGERPCVVWAANLWRPTGSLLVMTSEGVTELGFTNRTGPPERKQIIKQGTIIPEVAEQTNAMTLSFLARTGPRRTLSAEGGGVTGCDWPLLLVPTPDDLQVWQHHDEWRLAQSIPRSIEQRVRPFLAEAGYNASLDLDLSVGDINADGRDDLMLRRSNGGRSNIYSLYLQKTNGLFGAEPTLEYPEKSQPLSWLCWVDLNHDGQPDLIKSTWLNEPAFIPGRSSGKVLVSIYLADPQGRLPSEPQYVFRKNDWTPAVPIVDVDGDGLPDLALGYSLVDTREGVRKEITAKQLDFSLKLYFNRGSAGFPSTADCQRDMLIRLDQAELLLGVDRRQFFERYVRLGGDFNGDGKADLLVRDHKDRLSVYPFLSREKGFSPEPDPRFNCPGLLEDWEIKDLNNDGISDLIVKLAKDAGFKIFISQQ